jgi:hypothetical protein
MQKLRRMAGVTLLASLLTVNVMAGEIPDVGKTAANPSTFELVVTWFSAWF